MSVDELEREEEQTEPATRWQRVATGSTTWIILILAAMVIAFSVLEPDAFPTVANLRNIATNAAILLVVAVGMTFVIITAGIDLSVGSVLVFSGVVSAKAMNGMSGDGVDVLVVGLLVALGCGLAWGVLNGLLITKARVPPLIVTLGTLGMALGFAQIITNGVDVREVPARLITSIGVGRLFDQIPWLVVIAVAVAVIFGVVLAMTRFGRHTYAIGSNDEAARRAGINVSRHLVKLYAISGALAGLAGMMSLVRFSTTTIGGHSQDALTVITGVILGGTSLYGGRGTIIGTFAGSLLIGTINNGQIGRAHV